MKLDYSIIAFLLLVGRITTSGASVGEALALFALASLCGAKQWMELQKIKEHNKEFEDNVKVEFERAAQEINNLKSAVGAMGLGNTFKQSPMFRPLNGQVKK